MPVLRRLAQGLSPRRAYHNAAEGETVIVKPRSEGNSAQVRACRAPVGTSMRSRPSTSLANGPMSI